LLGSERGEDEWEYPDAVEERLDALEREGRGVGAGGGRAAQQEEEEEGGLLAFILDDYDVGEDGVNTEYWETWGAYAEWNEEEEAEVGQWDDYEHSVRADSEPSDEDSMDSEEEWQEELRIMAACQHNVQAEMDLWEDGY
jgi:hypothetical protein